MQKGPPGSLSDARQGLVNVLAARIAAKGHQDAWLAYLRATGLIADDRDVEAKRHARKAMRRHGGRRVSISTIGGKLVERPIAGAPPPGEKARRRKAAKAARKARRR